MKQLWRRRRLYIYAEWSPLSLRRSCSYRSKKIIHLERISTDENRNDIIIELISGQKIYGMARSMVVKSTCSHSYMPFQSEGGRFKKIDSGDSICCSLLYLLQKNNWGTLYICFSLWFNWWLLTLFVIYCSLSCCTQINIQNNVHSI